MVLCDLQVIQFGLGDGNEDSSNPNAVIAHLQKSQLDWGHSKALLRICNTIVDNLKTCLGELDEQDPPTSGNKGKKPPPKRQRKLPERYLSDSQSFEICSSFILVAKAQSDDPHGISHRGAISWHWVLSENVSSLLCPYLVIYHSDLHKYICSWKIVESVF
jgi:hypothetical protein